MATTLRNALDAHTHLSRTENGALTWNSSGNAVLDFYSRAGAARTINGKGMNHLFMRAYEENPRLALRALFYARDIRGGLGERQLPRQILHHLAQIYPEAILVNLPLIPHYGRWDDLLTLFDTPCEKDAIALIKAQLEKDRAALIAGQTPSLLAKWLPSENASNATTRHLARRCAVGLGLSAKAYRKELVRLRAALKIIENDLRTKNYRFPYAHVPSQALHKYRNAFLRNDETRYTAFLNDVDAGRCRMHTATVTPAQIVKAASTLLRKNAPQEARHDLNTRWNALPDESDGRNALVVIDLSGSMNCSPCGGDRPIDVAMALGIYLSERNHGIFHNRLIAFSRTARYLIFDEEMDLFQRIAYLEANEEVANTNLLKVFQLILDTALEHRLNQEDMPTTLYILSDMEFDEAASGTNNRTTYEMARASYAAAGYTLPQVVFWNLASRHGHQPVQANESGTVLVSGQSPVVFRQVLQNHLLTPLEQMHALLNSERYQLIQAPADQCADFLSRQKRPPGLN